MVLQRRDLVSVIKHRSDLLEVTGKDGIKVFSYINLK